MCNFAPRLDNIGLISVGVGPNMNTGELQAIADDPDSNNMFTMTDFNRLPSITKNLIDATCRGQWVSGSVVESVTCRNRSNVQLRVVCGTALALIGACCIDGIALTLTKTLC